MRSLYLSLMTTYPFKSADYADYTDYSNHLKDDAKSVGFNSPQLVGAKRRSRKAGRRGSSLAPEGSEVLRMNL